MLTGVADSGSAVTGLVGVGCALRMVSGGDAQELAGVGGVAMVVEFLWRAVVVGLFGWGSDDVLLILGGVVGVVWR
jgi:hypothetical protein